jgi:hypothetical protein
MVGRMQAVEWKVEIWVSVLLVVIPDVQALVGL